MSNPYTLLRPKSLPVGFVLCLFFGTIGIHRFYLRRPLARSMLILGLFGWVGTPFVSGLFLLLPIVLWWLVDLFFVAGWVHENNAAIRLYRGPRDLPDGKITVDGSGSPTPNPRSADRNTVERISF